MNNTENSVANGNNPIVCPCPKQSCLRHGECDACREHHAERGNQPCCERKPKS
jgi:hypothetical protein